VVFPNSNKHQCPSEKLVMERGGSFRNLVFSGLLGNKVSVHLNFPHRVLIREYLEGGGPSISNPLKCLTSGRALVLTTTREYHSTHEI
jgi:hypothetical protein